MQNSNDTTPSAVKDKPLWKNVYGNLILDNDGTWSVGISQNTETKSNYADAETLFISREIDTGE